MSVNTYRLFVVAAVIALVSGAVFMPSFVSAMDFKGKTVNIIVGAKPGGGADKYARLFAPFFKEHLPGKPVILVINKPGGGNLKASNWFHKNANPDGLTIMTITSSMHTHLIFGGKKVKYDEQAWRPFILSPRGTVIYARADTGVKGKDIVADIETLRKGKWITSLKTPTSAELRGVLALDLLGVNDMKYVFGLGTSPRRKAVIRGEMHISIDSAGAFLKQGMRYVKKGVLVPFMTLGFYQDGKIVRDPAFPDLETVAEAYEKIYGKKPSGPKWKAMTHLFHMGVSASKAFALPPKTPDATVKAWETAARHIVVDPAFQKLSKKALGVYPHSFGDEAKKIIDSTVGLEPETRKWMKNWMRDEFKGQI